LKANYKNDQLATGTETGLQQGPERTGFDIRPSIRTALVFVLLLALAVAATSIRTVPQTGYYDPSRAATFTIEVQSNTSWHGSYGSAESMTTVGGASNEYFQVQETIVSAVFQIETANDGVTLTVSIVQNSMVLATQTTTAAYGVVSLSANA